MGILALIVSMAGQPDPAAPGNAEPWTPAGWATVVVLVIIGVCIVVSNVVESGKRHDTDEDRERL